MSIYIYISTQINITYSIFQDIVANQNGAVISITSNDYNLYISTNIYKSCYALGQNRGGCIYFLTNRKLIIKNTCAYHCSANEGYFYYIRGNDQSLSSAELNETNTVNCSGNQNGVCANYNCNLLSSNYNSSYCHSDVTWCNVHSWHNTKSFAEYYQFYKNKLDILYGVNSKTCDNYIDHVILISNSPSRGLKGFFHVNEHENGGLHIRNGFAFNNDGCLINCEKGNIIIESLICDNYSYTMTLVNTANVTVNTHITERFFFDTNAFCVFQPPTQPCTQLHYNFYSPSHLSLIFFAIMLII